jgi:hypothetical protein
VEVRGYVNIEGKSCLQINFDPDDSADLFLYAQVVNHKIQGLSSQLGDYQQELGEVNARVFKNGGSGGKGKR